MAWPRPRPRSVPPRVPLSMGHKGLLYGGEGRGRLTQPGSLCLSHTHTHRDGGALPVAQARMRARMYVKLQPTLDYEADV